MWKQVLDLFRPLSDLAQAERELERARREYLEACSGQEFAAALITYNHKRIERLEAYLAVTRKRTESA
jgi:N-glycosylase/DNA lyase